MRNFSLTYPQPMNQALAQGLNASDFKFLRDSYELAVRLFDGFYRAQGTPFFKRVLKKERGLPS